MTQPYRDPAQPVSVRAADLLGRLTLREKVGQLNQRLLGWQTWTRGPAGLAVTKVLEAELERWGGLGALYGLQRADAWSGRDWSTGASPELSRELAALVQERVVAASRLGIPALFVEEAPHGHQALGSQLFPTNLGAGAAWRPDLLESAAAQTARELRARGVQLALVSGLDILRDPRWGRTEECFGEDPLLAAQNVRAVVRGMTAEPGLGVVLKHFAGQGAAIGGRNGSGTPIGPRELVEIHLPAARAGVAEGALGVMAAYNDIDGVPCTANTELLTGILRDEWGFDGIVMSDMFAIDRLRRARLTPAAAGALALRAGVDLSMCDESFAALEEAVERGLVTESLVDRAVRRVLELKLRLGLFDPPAPLPSFPPPSPHPDLVASTIVLVKNDLLPLTTPPTRVAVIGPNADDAESLLGDYVPPLPAGTGLSVVDVLREAVTVVHEPGCELTRPVPGGLERAAAAAEDADLAVLVLGATSRRDYADAFADNGAIDLGASRHSATTGEGFDAAEVTLPGAQLDLVDAVAATGTPTVAVIVSGRPHGIEHVAGRCGAVLYAWYPGPAGAAAIAEVLLGGREPVGRLPVSLPRSSAGLPVAYNERLELVERYVDGTAAPTYPFGFGLGYTTWSIGQPSLVDTHGLTATVTNTGNRRGETVAQLYARALVPGLVPRRAVLVGWARVALDPGASAEVTVPVEADARPALGLPSGGRVELWLSTAGAGEPRNSLRLRLS